MKKLLPHLTGAVFSLFILGVFVAVVSISFSGLGHIFPDNIFNQAIGLVLFDFAALTWFLVFVSGCKSTMQYVWSGLGFVVGLLGVLGLAGMEVGISSGWLIAADVTKPLSYVFIGVLLGHLTLIYLHHGSSPEISAQISLGIEKAKIQAEGMRQAEQQLQTSGGQLGNVIRGRLVGETLRDLNMDPSHVVDAKFLPVEMPAEDKPAALRFPWQKQNDLTKAVSVDVTPRKYPADAPAVLSASDRAARYEEFYSAARGVGLVPCQRSECKNMAELHGPNFPFCSDACRQADLAERAASKLKEDAAHESAVPFQDDDRGNDGHINMGDVG